MHVDIRTIVHDTTVCHGWLTPQPEALATGVPYSFDLTHSPSTYRLLHHDNEDTAWSLMLQLYVLWNRKNTSSSSP